MIRTYNIRKGKHSSKPRILKLWAGNTAHSFKFRFNSTMWHEANAIPIDGISKACGVAFGTHAENPLNKIPYVRNLINSVVIGWKPNYNFKNQFELYIISDSRGVEVRTKYFESIPIDKIVDIKVVKINKNLVVVTIDKVGIPVNLNALPFGYYLGFYYGGQSEAPQDMHEELEIL